MGSCVGGGESDGNMIQKAPMNQVNQQAAFALKHFVVGEKPIFQIFLREGLRGWVGFVGFHPTPCKGARLP